MDKRLEGVQAKFDELDRCISLDADRLGRDKNPWIIGFLGSLKKEAKPAESDFEFFYRAIMGEEVLPVANEYLFRGGANVPPITEEDVRYLFDYMKRHYQE